MGCGRVGSSLAETLDEQGATVAVIDQEATAFRRLPTTFGGRTVTGIGFDKVVMITNITSDIADARPIF